ncbi:leucine-rich repeat domain, L domain-like protein [Tanacetum coccineum]
MTPYFYSCCGNSNVVLKETQSGKNTGRKYYACPNAQGAYFGCNYFVWVDELIPCRCGQGLCHAISDIDRKGVFHQCPMDGDRNCSFTKYVKKIPNNRSSSSPGPSSSGKGCYSPGSSSAGQGSSAREGNCQDCKLLKMKIKILEAKLELASRHEDPSDESATLEDLLVALDGLLLG